MAELRMKLAVSPEFHAERLIEHDVGELWEVSARVEFVGAFTREGKITVLARAHECVVPVRNPEWGYERLEEAVKERLLKLVPSLKPEELQVWLYDVENGNDIAPPGSAV